MAGDNRFSFEELTAVAYQRERALARRLARQENVSAFAALEQVLKAAADGGLLAGVVEARRRTLAAAASRRALRQQASRLRFDSSRQAKAPDPAAWHAWFDGSAKPNPGPIGLGAVLRAPDGSLSTISRAGGSGDSNCAEYLALIAVLEHALLHRATALVVHGDSRIVIGDVLGTALAAIPGLEVERQRAQSLLQKFPSVSLVWIPRARNAAADALAHAGYLKNHQSMFDSVQK